MLLEIAALFVIAAAGDLTGRKGRETAHIEFICVEKEFDCPGT